jgi:hypothetical protein
MPFSKLQAPLDIDSRIKNDFVDLCRSINQRIFDSGKAHEGDLLRAMRYYLSVLAPISRGQTLNNPENLLNTAMFVANRALYTLVSLEVGYREKDLTERLIYASPGVAAHNAGVKRVWRRRLPSRQIGSADDERIDQSSQDGTLQFEQWKKAVI